jgi:hypothetical protein
VQLQEKQRGGTRNIIYRTMGVRSRSQQLRCVPPDQGRTLGQDDRAGAGTRCCCRAGAVPVLVLVLALAWSAVERAVRVDDVLWSVCCSPGIEWLGAWAIERDVRVLRLGEIPVCAQNRATIARTLQRNQNQNVYPMPQAGGGRERERCTMHREAQLLQAS